MPPSIRDRLDAHRAGLLKSIVAAAGAADTGKLLELTGQLQQAEQLLARHNSILADAEAVLTGSNQLTREELPPEIRQNGRPPRTSGRGHGGVVRAEFLRAAATGGLTLSPYQGTIYRTPKGIRVGIAVATERQPNRWFLGLTQDAFDAAVLLCQTKGGKTLEISLPATFIRAHRPRFSRAGGQEKFNVVRREGHVHLTIPGTGHVPVGQFVGAWTQLA